MPNSRDYVTPVAESVPFDNTSNCFVATDTQEAIEEVNSSVSSAASPGFSLGRSGNVPSNTWLFRTGNVPSNKTGIPMAITNPTITLVAVGNEDINTFDVEIYEHDGDEVNLTLLGTVNLVATRTDTFTVSFVATEGKQLGVKIVNGSAKNPGVDLQLSGTQ